MKNVIITLAVVVLLGLLAWYFYFKPSTAAATPATATGGVPIIPLPPASTPPIVGVSTAVTAAGLFSTDDGPGGSAVAKRQMDLRASGASADILNKLDVPTLMKMGVSAANAFETNVLNSLHISSLSQLPVDLNQNQISAIKACTGFAYSDSVNQWDNMTKVSNGLYTLRAQLNGLSWLTNDQLLSLEKTRDTFFSNYGKIPSNLKSIKAADFKNWVIAYMNDSSQFCKNYLNLVNQVIAGLKEEAIQDLRKSGWKFIGYDAPAGQ